MINNYDIFFDICQSRKSTRSFSEKIIEEEVIEKILEVAYTSPYASGRKNWEILVVKDQNIIIKIAEIVEKKTQEISNDVKEDFRDSFINYAESFVFLKEAPILFIPIFRISPGMSIMIKNENIEIGEWERDNYVKSISCVSMLITLAAESLGVKTCYMTGPLIAENEIKKIINIKPGRTIGAVIPAGYSKGE